MADDNQNYHGDHFEMYRNIESLLCAPGNNIVLQVNYTSITNKQKHSHRKRDHNLWLPEVRGWVSQVDQWERIRLPMQEPQKMKV